MSKVLIIAEAGVNHNGNIEIAKKLAQVAKECGADVVKFQTAKLDSLVSKCAPMADYQKQEDTCYQRKRASFCIGLRCFQRHRQSVFAHFACSFTRVGSVSARNGRRYVIFNSYFGGAQRKNNR